ncbi:MAG: GC-type dockerin domain-anchored protein [Planctomycetota bacterium]
MQRLVLISVLIPAAAAAQPAIQSGTIGAGGGTSESGAARLSGSIGLLGNGFWVTVLRNPRPGRIDFNMDGVVNISDLFAFITAFTDPEPDPRTDFNGDGVINISDLFAFVNEFVA